jgi:REP-associated tyrosine transposase
MPRVARGLADNQVYHILNRGKGRQDVFHKPEDFAAFLRLIAEAKGKYPIQIIAYCLMTNHFHLLVKAGEGSALGKWMQWLMTSHVRRYHRHYGSSGHVWQGRFKSFPVQDDDHLLTVVRYVEGNPVRAGMVKSARDWPWSSHRENAALCGTGSQRVPVPLDAETPAGTGQAIEAVGETGQAPFEGQMEPVPVVDGGLIRLPPHWTDYVDAPMTGNELNQFRQSVDRQTPFGDRTWQERICRTLGLESTLRPLGRPKKTAEK